MISLPCRTPEIPGKSLGNEGKTLQKARNSLQKKKQGIPHKEMKKNQGLNAPFLNVLFARGF